MRDFLYLLSPMENKSYRIWGSLSCCYVVWDITPSSPLKVNWRFRGTCRLHLQGRRRSQTINQHEACLFAVCFVLVFCLYFLWCPSVVKCFVLMKFGAGDTHVWDRRSRLTKWSDSSDSFWQFLVRVPCSFPLYSFQFGAHQFSAVRLPYISNMWHSMPESINVRQINGSHLRTVKLHWNTFVSRDLMCRNTTLVDTKQCILPY
jgi:hypothetical protein